MGRPPKEPRKPTCGCCGAMINIDKTVCCPRGCNANAPGCGICGRRRCAVDGCRCPDPAAIKPSEQSETVMLWGTLGLAAA